MKVFNSENSQLIDRLTIYEGVPSIILMENAAFAVVDRIENKLKAGDTVTIFAGKGNNGGDGFAVARLLHQRGFSTNIIFCGEEDDLDGNANINFKILEKMNLDIININDDFDNTREIEFLIRNSDLVVDAIFGIGFRGSLNYELIKLVNLINEFSKYTISIDIATGINSNTGEVNLAIEADETVTFGFYKPGHLLYPGHIYSGDIYIYDIGFLDIIIDKVSSDFHTLSKEEAFNKLPKREIRSNKGSHGRAMVLAGSNNMTGALSLAAKSAYKTGAGYVYGASVPAAIDKLKSYVPEVLTVASTSDVLDINFYDEIIDLVYKMDVVALGPGLGTDRTIEGLVFKLLKNITCPIVLDADALNIAGKNLNVIKNIKAPVVITPHPGEMSRLTGLPTHEILNNTVKVARDFSKEYGVITVLKDSRTIISDEEGNVYINTTGNSALAKAGSGDVLTGMITGLIAQGLEPFEAAYLAVYFHGRAGDLASKDLGSHGVLASDLNKYIFK